MTVMPSPSQSHTEMGRRVTTADGSHGQKGFVTDALPETYDFYCACGPIPMLKAVYDAAPTSAPRKNR